MVESSTKEGVEMVLTREEQGSERENGQESKAGL
jgi:hypothetical protein